MTIQARQTYRAANTLDEGRRIFIEAYQPGSERAYVVDADTGKRFRSIRVSQLHAEPVTRSGQPRRSGYVLETDGNDR
ncbi:hypothetical protein ACFVHW_31800 [Streptomyces sp. NPDC127110]|uniref:hypothetical protein n=1 Tax=Streptomyces sp. NPDC127110 TaxID=3345362 RepID=UPI0036362B07